MIESRARSGAAPVPGWMDEAQLTPAEDFETEVASGRLGALGPSLPHPVRSMHLHSSSTTPHSTVLTQYYILTITDNLVQYSSHAHGCKGFLIYYDGKLQQIPKVTLLPRLARDNSAGRTALYSRNHLCNSTKEPVQ